MSFPKSTLLSEFGWEPINEFLDRQRVNYFARFDELPAHRLCKIVFMELKNSECVEWNYMKNIFQSIGLDHYYYGNFNTNIFKYLKKINLRESSKCNICDDDMVEDLHHFLFECKTLNGTRQELFEEMETNKIVLSGSCIFRATAISKSAVLDRRHLSWC
jgi:predicted DNA-binding antitoxin AbrB/MazE fold protein